jgi:hypothetical protein
MARTLATNFSGALQFPKADAATDLFKKEDVQQLALAVDQHNHTSGKGLVLGAVDMPDWFRSTGHTTAFPGTGSGIEMYFEPGSQGVIQSFNRGGNVYAGLVINGSSIVLNAASNSGATAGTAYLTCSYAGSPLAPAITTSATIWPSATPGIKFASGGYIQDYFTGGQGYVQISQLTVSPGSASFATTNVNGPLVITGANTAVFSGAVTCQTTLSVTGGSFFSASLSLGASASIVWPSGATLGDGGSGYVSASKITVATLACGTFANNGAIPNVTTPLVAAYIGASGPVASYGGMVTFGNEVGQGNGAQATLPLVKGSAFGPTNQGGTGWVKFGINGAIVYFPYWV